MTFIFRVFPMKKIGGPHEPLFSKLQFTNRPPERDIVRTSKTGNGSDRTKSIS
jgi:hypothetical protein